MFFVLLQKNYAVKLFVFGSAMRTCAKLLEPFPAGTTEKTCSGLTEIAQEKDEDEKQEENTADFGPKCCKCKEQITEDAAPEQRKQIKYSFAG